MSCCQSLSRAPLIVDCFSPSGATLPCDEEAVRLSENQDHIGGGEDDVGLGLDQRFGSKTFRYDFK